MDLYAHEQIIERLEKIQDDLDLIKEKFEINDEEEDDTSSEDDIL